MGRTVYKLAKRFTSRTNSL